MSIRRQCYEWRNVGESNHFQITPPLVAIDNCDDVVLNRYPISAVSYKLGMASEKIFWKIVPIASNQVVDIFNGGIGNNLDIPGQLKAYQFIVLDGIAVYPETFNAQIIVNTTRYFQDPDNVPSRLGGISGRAVPYPIGALSSYPPNPNLAVQLQNSIKDGLQPPIIIKPGDRWSVEVKNNSSSSFPYGTDAQIKRGTDRKVARCYIKYLLIDGADCIVAQRLIDAGWPLTVENLWRYKQDLIKSHLYASMAELPEAIENARRKV
tara:strand:+ start:1057 stop:1851 length:795 start_codon:yes stop_codon:yes gene_type:complete